MDTDFIRALLIEKKEFYGQQEINKQGFEDILRQIGQNNESYKLDESVIQDLYRLLEEKQGGKITIEGVEALILQCLIEEQHVEQQIQEDFEEGEEFHDLTLESINQLYGVFLKAAGRQKEHCLFSNAEKQIELLEKNGSLLMDKSKAISIFTILSQSNAKVNISPNDEAIILNEDMQLFVSKFQNFLLLKCGMAQVQNEQSAYVFHESEDENEIKYHSKNSNKGSLIRQQEDQELKSITQEMKELKGKEYISVKEVEILLKKLQSETIILENKVEEKEAQMLMLKQECEQQEEIIKQKDKNQEQTNLSNLQVHEHCEKLQDIIDKQNSELRKHLKQQEEHTILYKNLNTSYRELQEKNTEISSLQNKIVALIQQNKDIQQNFELIQQELQARQEKVIEIQIPLREEKDVNQDIPLAIKKLEKEKNVSKELIEQLTEEIEQLKSNGSFQQVQIDNFTKIIEMKEEFIDELNREVINLKKRIDELIHKESEQLILKVPINHNNLSIKMPSQRDTATKGMLSLQEDTQELNLDSHRSEIHISQPPQHELISEIQKQDMHEDEKQSDKISVHSHSSSDLSSISSELSLEETKKNNYKSQVKKRKSTSASSLKYIQQMNQKLLDTAQKLNITPLNSRNLINLQLSKSSSAINKSEQKNKSYFSQAAIDIIQTFRVKNESNIPPSPSSISEFNSNSNFRIDLKQPAVPPHEPSSNSLLFKKKAPTRLNEIQEQPYLAPLGSTSIKAPSFQQVLEEGAEYFWDEIKKYNLNSSSHQYSSQVQKSSLQQFFSSKKQDNNTMNFNGQSLPKNSCTDYLLLKDDPRFLSIFSHQDEPSTSNSQLKKKQNYLQRKELDYFYSDSIYRINSDQKKERRILCATSLFVYIINPNSGFKVVRKIDVTHINKLTFSNKNSNLFVIHVLNQAEYVIESCRRFDFNQFLSNLFKNLLKIPAYMIMFIDNIQIANQRISQNSLPLHPQVSKFQTPKESKKLKQMQENLQQQQQQQQGQQQQHPKIRENSASPNKIRNFKLENSSENKKERRKEQIKQVFQVMIKKEQSKLKSLFINPWKKGDLTIEGNKITIKESDQIIEIKNDLKSVVELGENQIQILMSHNNSIQLKILEMQDYNTIFTILCKILASN